MASKMEKRLFICSVSQILFATDIKISKRKLLYENEEFIGSFLKTKYYLLQHINKKTILNYINILTKSHLKILRAKNRPEDFSLITCPLP